MKRKLTKEEKKQYNNLSKEEKKIYDSIMRFFPSTHPDSAYNKAIEGGCNFQYIPK